MKIRKKIGIFGGLFDPPHIGHLILGQWVLEEFNLNRIIFIPAFKPPHKDIYSPFKHRYKMIEISIRDNKRFFLSDIERYIRGKTYTYKVLQFLKKSNPLYSESDLYLIIGADQWNEIEHWKKPDTIFRYAQVVVLPRPNYNIKDNSPFYKKIMLSNAPLIDISSTMVRERIKAGLSIDYLVIPEVQDYIKREKLYIT
uniref:Probable nicotinate-nucleotide adenylyltransferase n=1 Tax=candidate division WOR-3 bacterium TaxID=2052148 RepID=A0A7V3RH02_UNCW3